jgi:hypothetical protein
MRIALAAFLLLALTAGVAGAAGTTVNYRLYHLEGVSWIQYYPGDTFPAGGNLPGTNRWRYVYQLLNDSAPGPITTFFAFFNSDGVRHADYPNVGANAPGGWSPTYLGPPSGQNAWRERFRGLSVPVVVGGNLGGFQVDFTWNDPVLPGAQAYDAQFSTGSEIGITTAVRRPVPAAALTWGQLRRAFR